MGDAVHPPHVRRASQNLLNNLKKDSILGWLDFEEAFNSNFSNTYKRPNRPQQLSMCRQRDDKTDREYLRGCDRVASHCLVCARVQTRQHAVAEAAKRDAEHTRRNDSDRRQLRAGRPNTALVQLG